MLYIIASLKQSRSLKLPKLYHFAIRDMNIYNIHRCNCEVYGFLWTKINSFCIDQGTAHATAAFVDFNNDVSLCKGRNLQDQ